MARSVRHGNVAQHQLCGTRGCRVALAESARADLLLVAKSGQVHVEEPVLRALEHDVSLVEIRDWGEGIVFDAIAPLLARARRVFWMADLSAFGAMMSVLTSETLAKVGAKERFLGINDGWLDALGRARGCGAWVDPAPGVGRGGPVMGRPLPPAELRFVRRIFRESPSLASLYAPRCTRMLLDGTSLELDAFQHEPARKVIANLLRRAVEA